MRGITHSIIGIGIFSIFFFINQTYKFFDLSLIDIIISFFIVFIYSQMPDIDQQGSKINNWSNIGLVALGIYSIFLKQYYVAVAMFVFIGILQMVHHRLFIHSIVSGLIFSSPLYFINPIYSIFAFVSYLIHLIMDGEISFFGVEDWW